MNGVSDFSDAFHVHVHMIEVITQHRTKTIK